MKKIIIIICLIIPEILFCNTYRVLLTDKGSGEFSKGTEKYENALKSITKKCIERRIKNGIQEENVISEKDIPINQLYINEIENLGAKVLLKLKWLNYIIVDCDSAIAEQVKTLPFVKKIVSTDEKPLNLEVQNTKLNLSAQEIILNKYYGYENNFYGYSYGQLKELNAEQLHSLGINGTGIHIGMLDNGFVWKECPYLNKSKVMKEWDFIFNDSIPANQENDVPGQDGHGSLVFSTIASIGPDSIIGIAPMCDFSLGKTEDNRYELHIEEDNYAAGVEWNEALGADILSTSLGYRNLSINPYDFSNLDGESSISSYYLNEAFARGMLPFTAIGNSGPRDSTLIAPSDATNAVSVGATVADSIVVAGFSSRGPNAKGKIKPDICVRGAGVFCVLPYSNAIVPMNGTSVACPLASGAASLILSAAPYLTASELIKTLKQSSSNKSNPDNILGWGRPDLLKVLDLLLIAVGEPAYYDCGSYKRFVINVISPYRVAKNFIYIKFYDSEKFEKFPLKLIDGQYLYVADFKKERFGGKEIEFYFECENKPTIVRKPINKEFTYKIMPDESFIPFGIDSLKLPILESAISEHNMKVRIFPEIINNSNSEIILELAVKDGGEAIIEIIAISGEIIKRFNFDLENDSNIQSKMNFSDLPNGTYIISIRLGGNFICKKFIKVN